MTLKLSGKYVNHNGPIMAKEIAMMSIDTTNYNLLGKQSLIRPGKIAHDRIYGAVIAAKTYPTFFF